MPAGRNNPTHLSLPRIVGNNLTQLGSPIRWRLSGLVHELYGLRIIADYRPEVDVDEPEARVAMGLMVQAFGCLEQIAWE